MNLTLVSVLAYFVSMLGIGVYAMRHSETGNSGYLLGGRKLGPAVTALSAGASDMSAWILMGLPGAMVVSGLSSLWIVVGLVLGAWWNYRLVAPRLRVYTELADDALTLPDFFSTRFGDRSHCLRIASASVIVVFFTLYTASGLVAGGVLFENSFGLSYQTGLWVTLVVVVAYTMMGGFHAVCLTDFVQGCLMLAALLLVPLVALGDFGGFAPVRTIAVAQKADYMNLLAGVGGLAIVSNLAWGLGYFGQPHIIVRFMAIRSVRDIGTARRIGMGWMMLSLAGSVLTGFVGLAWLSEHGVALPNPETVFITLAQALFHPLVAGFLLAAILAAIMSTVSSQLLVSASSLSEDVYRVFIRQQATPGEAVMVSRVTVALVAVTAALIARDPESTILGIVSNAWAGFGAAFGPVVLLSLFWKRMNWQGALAGMLTGALVVILWITVPVLDDGATLSSLLYEIVPGFALAMLAIVLVSRMTPVPGKALTDGHDHMLSSLREQTGNR